MSEEQQDYRWKEVSTPAMDEETIRLMPVAKFVMDKWQLAKDDRAQSEQIWLSAYNQWRGRYSAEENMQLTEQENRNPGSSKIFIKLTKTKVQAAYSQILDIVEAGGAFPISITHTPVPDQVPEYIHMDSEAAPAMDNAEDYDIYGYSGDDREISPGATHNSMFDNIKSFITNGKGAKKGPSPDKTKMPQFHPAELAAQKNNKIMQDQLQESLVKDSVKRAVLDTAKYGTGIIKGPFNYKKTTSKWSKDPISGDAIYDPLVQWVPKIDHVSIWNFYPDPEAKTMDDCEYVIERHLLGRSKMKDLTNMSSFSEEAIGRVLSYSPTTRSLEDWEHHVRDNSNLMHTDRYEVLEYWGYFDSDLAMELGLEGDEYEDLITKSIQVNIWVCGNEILRFIVNPFTPQVIPYYAVPYEMHSDQIWGIGVPENMRDTQALMNTHMRLAIDNLRLAGNVMFEVNENYLVPGQDMKVYPGKIWRKNGGAPGQSIFTLSANDTSQSHMMMFDKCRQISDEQTGLPSYSHGSTGVMSTGRTASGMNMLMGAAQLSIKTVIKNLDQYLLEPLGRNLFAWNMQFNQDNFAVEGDLKVVAKGTTALMQREVFTQKLMTLMQVAMSNPATAPLFNPAQAIRDICISMDLDPEKYLNSPEVQAIYNEMIAKMDAQNAAPQQQGSAPVGADPNDPTNTGGGNIGVPTPQSPGSEQFSGNMQPSGNPTGEAMGEMQ